MKAVALLIVTLLLIQNVAQAGIIDFFKRLLQMDDTVDLTFFDQSDTFNNNTGGTSGEALTVPMCNITPNDNFLEPQVPLADFDTLTKDNNMFAVNFYKSLNDTKANVIVAALAENLAGGLVYAGASGDTASGIAKAFNYELADTDIHRAFHQYLEKFTWDVMGGVNLVNTIWAQEGIMFSDAYNQILNNDYNECVR
jgi:serine protease inhibitor